jgi:hypothetical protein
MDAFMIDLDKLKSKYTEEGPQFPGSNLVWQETASKLIIRAADYLTMSNKKESDVSLNKLHDKINELEQKNF